LRPWLAGSSLLFSFPFLLFPFRERARKYRKGRHSTTFNPLFLSSPPFFFPPIKACLFGRKSWGEETVRFLSLSFFPLFSLFPQGSTGADNSSREGVMWIVRTGSPWLIFLLFFRFSRWRSKVFGGGFFDVSFPLLSLFFPPAGHQHAAGAKKGGSSSPSSLFTKIPHGLRGLGAPSVPLFPSFLPPFFLFFMADTAYEEDHLRQAIDRQCCSSLFPPPPLPPFLLGDALSQSSSSSPSRNPLRRPLSPFLSPFSSPSFSLLFWWGPIRRDSVVA